MATTTPNLVGSKEHARPTTDDVRVIGLHEYKEAALCLAEAFKHDEVVQYPINTRDMKHRPEEAKWKLHVAIMEFMVTVHAHKGLVTTIGPNYNSVAIWCLPNTHVDWFTLVRSGMWSMYFKLSPEGRRRFYSEFLPLLHETKSNVLAERDNDAYYLVYIGTRPQDEGKGYGKALIEHITQRADAENRACYLESSALKNNGMYRKRGFSFTKKIYLNYADSPICMDIMVREPARPGEASRDPSDMKRPLQVERESSGGGMTLRRASPAA
ncbi:MAG: hypothetical protein M1833_005636 [Piccolia ochrophora]|nr:MAG: hypothetical protein M1833_005636 [Piccolia ochrophora]